ncbi:MAG: transaldolase, partial [Dehalococcoidia bacterium]|nr:transaldolase [Dehalococcoidia bacterium]
MAHAIDQLRQRGQSVWLDYIRRGLITSGELERMVRDRWVSGVTSNPTIFQKAIAGSEDYDDALRRIHQRGECSAYEAFLELGGDDIRSAADVLRPVYDETNGADGFVSFEAQEADAQETIDEVRRMWALVDRPNVLIKVPGTQAGVQAVEQLIAEGININITLLFDVDVYEQVANAYISGLEQRSQSGQPVDNIASVASFFVSRVDTKADELLPDGSPLRGKIAVANAVLAYKRFQQIFSGPRWQKLAGAGARVQRPLWASTGTKSPEYSDVLYVEELVAPHTVNTMPEQTLRAFLDHGKVRPAIEEQLDTAEETLKQAADAGIDLKEVTSRLLTDGLAAFGKDFDKLLGEIDHKIQIVPHGRPRHGGKLADLAGPVERRLESLQRENVIERIWRRDHTLWKPDPTEITNRLGWLTIVDTMVEATDELKRFAGAVAGDGYKTAVLLGMGGSSLAPEVLYETFGAGTGGLELKVLDTTDPASIKAVEESIDLQRSLFIVASKSGATIETLSHFAYFWEKVPDGRHFIAITDPGTPLQTLARERGFR